MDDLKSIIDKKDNNMDKAKSLIQTYSEKKKIYYKNEKNVKDLNTEDDAEWYKEVCDREKRKEKEKEEQKNKKEA